MRIVRQLFLFNGRKKKYVMVLLSDVVYYIILLDAIGAFGVVIWMIVWFLHNDSRYEPHHWTMWALQEDRENTAVQLLFASLEFILGTEIGRAHV